MIQNAKLVFILAIHVLVKHYVYLAIQLSLEIMTVLVKMNILMIKVNVYLVLTLASI